MKTVAIIDYGMGNLHSAKKAVEHVAPDTTVLVTDNAEKIREADRVILPGVGAIRDCMAEMHRLGVVDLVREVSQDRPFLGICVGMQALMESSQENGGVDCLGLVKGQVKLFTNGQADGKPVLLESDGEALKVPHMGWNIVQQTQSHPLWAGIADGTRFYFVHSYYITLDPSETAAGMTHYGVDFAAALSKGNVFAVQFHPEKSQHGGLQLLSNFLAWNGES